MARRPSAAGSLCRALPAELVKRWPRRPRCGAGLSRRLASLQHPRSRLRLGCAEFAGTGAAPAAAAKGKAFRAGEPQASLPSARPSAAPAAWGRRPEGSQKAPRCSATLRTAAAGSASCYGRCRPLSRWIASARAPATRSWPSRERAPGGGGARAPTPRRGPARAGPPRPARTRQPMAQRGRLLCKSAEASAFIEKSTQSAPPPGLPSSRFPALLLRCANACGWWTNGRLGRGLCDQARSLIMRVRA